MILLLLTFDQGWCLHCFMYYCLFFFAKLNAGESKTYHLNQCVDHGITAWMIYIGKSCLKQQSDYSDLTFSKNTVCILVMTHLIEKMSQEYWHLLLQWFIVNFPDVVRFIYSPSIILSLSLEFIMNCSTKNSKDLWYWIKIIKS